MRAIGERCPTAAGTLEPKPLDDRQFDRFLGVSGDDTGVMFKETVLAIVAIVGVSEMEHRCYSTQGNVFQRRAHQLRVRRRVNFSLHVSNLDSASSACALKRLRSVFRDSARA